MKTITDEKGLIRIPDFKLADDNIVYSFKGRQIDLEKRILVYKNLNKNCYSIKQNGLVVAHAERFCLRRFVPIIYEKGRQKVLQTKTKTVHAYLKGFYETSGMGCTAARGKLLTQIKYDPYKYPFFYTDNTTSNILKVKSGLFITLTEKGILGAYISTERV